jgi:hypothetical protein
MSQSLFAGPGRTELNKNYASDAKIFDSETGHLIFKLNGLRYHMLDFQDTPYAAHLYSRLVWGPDLTLSPQACKTSGTTGWQNVQDIADLIAHKKPNAKVAETSLVPQDASSVWLEGISSDSKARNAFGSYILLASDASAIVLAQNKYESIPRTAFQLLDLGKPLGSEQEETLKEFDLVILRLPSAIGSNIDTILANVGKLIREDGYVLVLEQRTVWEPNSADADNSLTTNGFIHDSTGVFKTSGFDIVHSVDCENSASLLHAYLAMLSKEPSDPRLLPLDVVHFSQPGHICSEITGTLSQYGWDVQHVHFTDLMQQIRRDSSILVISELETPQLPTLTPQQWDSLQQLLQKRNRILWVSKSAQWQVKNPDGAMIYGLCRSVRTEDPSMRLTTLDVEDPTNDKTIPVIDTLLRTIQEPMYIKGFEGEYVERRGILHVSRILGDDRINALERGKTTGTQPVEMRLHECPTTVRMIAERVGSIDSLHYVEVDSKELPLPDDKVEVELFASALNFKDVAVTMGIVPENHHLLGLEGAGYIRRLGANLHTPFHVGQRVLVFEKGTFANRIIATTERTISIPDWLSFEDAATLPSVYLTALYSLFDLASLKKGDRVLIHSASGGLGIASIQICHSIGAEVFVTVGQEVKKQFLRENFDIPADHIFNSRTTEFEA